MPHVYVLNGPNLGRLGTREPDVYGRMTFAELSDDIVRTAEGLGLTATVLQTDSEAELIGWLHRAQDEQSAVVLNPAEIGRAHV